MGKEGIDGVRLPASIGFYRDVMSVNTARGGESRSIKLGLEQDGKPEAEMEMETSMADDQESIELEEYKKRPEQAIKVFESAPKHFLQ
jgi:hypothetical protein